MFPIFWNVWQASIREHATFLLTRFGIMGQSDLGLNQMDRSVFHKVKEISEIFWSRIWRIKIHVVWKQESSSFLLFLWLRSPRSLIYKLNQIDSKVNLVNIVGKILGSLCDLLVNYVFVFLSLVIELFSNFRYSWYNNYRSIVILFMKIFSLIDGSYF